MRFSSVRARTRYTVKARTKTAPMPRPAMMTGRLEVTANAPTTPSREKAASSTLRYTNRAAPAVATCVPAISNDCATPSMTTKSTTPTVPAKSIVAAAVGTMKEDSRSTESVSATSMASMPPHLDRYRSTMVIQCTVLRSLKKYLSATMNRNAAPNAAIATCAFSMYSPYCEGSKSASFATTSGESPAAAATMNIGRTKRVPNTATGMPHMRKRRCQRASIRPSTFAFTTALSNESVVSRTASRRTRKRAGSPPQRNAAAPTAMDTSAGKMNTPMDAVIVAQEAAAPYQTSVSAGVLRCMNVRKQSRQSEYREGESFKPESRKEREILIERPPHVHFDSDEHEEQSEREFRDDKREPKNNVGPPLLFWCCHISQ